jgi:DNA-binding NarL/FixJ family response regulator
VLVVHPEEHARTSLRSALQQQGVTSVLTQANAPAAIGQCVLEQPDVVVLAAGCPMMTADDAVGQLRRYCPHTLVVVCDAQQQQVATLLEAGADAVYTRPVTRDVICQDLMDRLQD